MKNRIEASFVNVTATVYKITLYYDAFTCNIYIDTTSARQDRAKQRVLGIIEGTEGYLSLSDLDAVRRAVIINLKEGLEIYVVKTTNWTR